MSANTRIFNGEDNKNLFNGLPINQSELRAYQATLRLETLKAEQRFCSNVEFPKLTRAVKKFEIINFLANMSHLGGATGIWLHRMFG